MDALGNFLVGCIEFCGWVGVGGLVYTFYTPLCDTLKLKCHKAKEELPPEIQIISTPQFMKTLDDYCGKITTTGW